MKTKSTTVLEYPPDEIAVLVSQLYETERRLQVLTGGEVDAVIYPDGQSYLLHEAQEQLRASEAAQREAAAMQSSILNALPAHVALIDRDGVIILVNDGWRHFAESQVLEMAASVPGQNYVENCERAQGNGAREARRAALGMRAVLSGAAPEFVLEYLCPSSPDPRWFHLKVTPLQRAGPGGAVVMHLETTERKKLEAQILRSQRMETIGTMAGGVAHDLNNILAPILMSVDLLQPEVTSKLGRETLASIEKCSQRAGNLVRQILSFARGIEGERVAVNLAQLVRELQSMLRESFPKNIAFEFEPLGEPWLVTGDPTQLHQVFMNLCVNARDAMPEGGTLTVAMENIVWDETGVARNSAIKAGAYVRITVTDTGAGMAPEIRERIFEPFFTTKELGRGSGLGLSTTEAIVRSHGGTITVSSEPGKGATFVIHLPASMAIAPAAPPKVAPSRHPGGQGELVLFVDDEDAVRFVAQKILELFGYRVVLATNGAEAVALYAAQRDEIALVIIDIAMPVMDGRAAIIALRAIEPGVKIIGCSGHAAPEGLEHFIPKPFTTEVMLTTIHLVLHPPARPASAP